ncbi:MAG: hypothetical protein IKU60_03725 [Clostridia bacterium]|nr:hypothetical protein [Clostridia bacterium]
MKKNVWNDETEKGIKGVVEAKSKWHAANDIGDEDGMKAAEEEARGYYKGLVDAGNYDVAKDLQGMNFDEAKGFMSNYMGTRKVDTNRGMALENTRTATDAAKSQGEFAGEFKDMWKDGYQKQEDRIDADPMDTKAAKAIMERYRGLGEEARGDALADGSVRNDGNLDSFTKANADRQRQAYEEAGIDTVFDLHERNVEAGGQNYRDMMQGGTYVNDAYNDTIANAKATAESANDAENENRQSDADITGQVPEALNKEGNVFFNEDGTLKNPEWDFQAIINEAEARGDMETKRQAEEARLWKVQNVEGFEEYAPTVKVPEAQRTESGKQFDETVDLKTKEIEAETELEKGKTEADLYAEAAKYEAMGMPDIAEGLRRYAAGQSDGDKSEEAEEGAPEEGNGNEEITDNAPVDETKVKNGLSKAEIIRKIHSMTTDEDERRALYGYFDILDGDLDSFYKNI